MPQCPIAGDANARDEASLLDSVSRPTATVAISPDRQRRQAAGLLLTTITTVIMIIINVTTFTVLLSRHNHCESSPGSSDEC